MTTLRRLYTADAPLTLTAVLMVAALIPALAGLWLDPRLITGAPAWLKPAKFAVSTAIYTLTLAWVFTYLPEWVRTRRIVGRGSAAILIFEVGAIYLQAWRGTTSHFNVATPVDAALFATMGLAIVIQTVGAAVVAVALWRQPFADAALGWALRLGLTRHDCRRLYRRPDDHAPRVADRRSARNPSHAGVRFAYRRRA